MQEEAMTEHSPEPKRARETGMGLRALSRATWLCAMLASIMDGAETISFEKDVYPTLAKAGCASCHSSNGVANATRLQFPDEEPNPAEITGIGLSLRPLIDPAAPEKSLLAAKPTQRVPHAGGKRISPGSPEEGRLVAWARHLASLPEEKGARHAAPIRNAPNAALHRLTHTQYDNTVRDLLGDQTNPARQFPAEDYVNGFLTQVQGQSISPLLAEAYAEAAERIARNAVARGGAGIPNCAPGQTTCRDRFVRDFAARAFRRPPTASEVARLSTLFDQGGPALAIEAMLQSASFLYWSEPSLASTHKGYARASRLAYLLWNTAPDAALLTAAASGELDTAVGVEKHARRLLASPRAHHAVDEFIGQWMRFDRVIVLLKERRLFPRFNREVAQAMAEETRRLAAGLVWNNGNFMDFFRAGYSYLNADLAAVYGLPEPKEQFARVAYPAGSNRAGILGQGTFLAATSKPGETSPTSRGLFIRELFLCQHVPPPPPGVNGNLPPVTEAKPMTTRERLKVHLNNEACASCHNLIDPIGLGFEKFDAAGAPREKEKLTIPTFDRKKESQTVELDLLTAGSIAGIPNSNFETPADLGRILAETRQCQMCVVKQYFRYAMGRMETAADRPVLDAVFEDFRKSGFYFQELMISLVRRTEFPDPAAVTGGR
ncbi:MAG: DUF1592 domain-containing protein [Acidobacteria bacterium]|nr:DUF1592 domain-containing protein [Acidobacteriota bacterium]